MQSLNQTNGQNTSRKAPNRSEKGNRCSNQVGKEECPSESKAKEEPSHFSAKTKDAWMRHYGPVHNLFAELFKEHNKNNNESAVGDKENNLLGTETHQVNPNNQTNGQNSLGTNEYHSQNIASATWYGSITENVGNTQNSTIMGKNSNIDGNSIEGEDENNPMPREEVEKSIQKSEIMFFAKV